MKGGHREGRRDRMEKEMSSRERERGKPVKEGK